MVKACFGQLEDGWLVTKSIFSCGFKIPGCMNASLLSQFTAFHRILFKVIARFMEFAFLSAVKF